MRLGVCECNLWVVYSRHITMHSMMLFAALLCLQATKRYKQAARRLQTKIIVESFHHKVARERCPVPQICIVGFRVCKRGFLECGTGQGWKASHPIGQLFAFGPGFCKRPGVAGTVTQSTDRASRAMKICCGTLLRDHVAKDGSLCARLRLQGALDATCLCGHT